MVETTNVFVWRSFEKMLRNLLHSFAKPSLVEDRRYTRLTIVLTRPFLVSAVNVALEME